MGLNGYLENGFEGKRFLFSNQQTKESSFLEMVGRVK